MANDLPPARASRRPFAAWACVAGIAALLGAYCASKLEVTSDIGHFLPDGEAGQTLGVLKRLASAPAAQRMVLTLDGAEPEVLARASTELARRLSLQREIAAVRNGAPAQAQREIFGLYFPRRFALFSESPEQAYSALLSDVGLEAASRRLLLRLGGVDGTFVRQIAAEDPLLLFERILERLELVREGGLQLRDGVFLSRDAKAAVLFVETRGAALDAASQRPVLQLIAREIEQTKRALGVNVRLEQSGINRYVVHAEQAIRADVQRISSVSSLALLLLFFVLFRSPRALLLVSLPPALGMLAATAVLLALFGRVHGVTLAFGTTLIGVGVDYPVHLVVHHTLGEQGRSAHATLRAIWPALLLGSLTTLAGMIGFGWAALPGIREMALFITIGVLVSLLVTRFALPHMLEPGGRATSLQRVLAAGLGRATSSLVSRPWLCVALLALALGLCAAGLPALRFRDDLASWVPASERLRAEDARVRGRLFAADPGKIVVTSAASVDAALAANDRAAAVLADAVQAGELGGFRSLHSLIWSAPLQRRNMAALERAPALRDRLTRVLDAAGFEAGAFAPFFEALERRAPPLALRELLGSSLAPIAGAFVLDLHAPVTFITYLQGVRDLPRLQRRLAALPEARYFDQQVFLSSTYAAFRSRVLELIALGLVAVFGMVLARYRSLRPALAAVVPAVLASGGALAVLALCGVAIDLFHVIGLLLVLSMGEDYGVFLVESRGVEGLSATMLALVLACASTVLSFGLLAFSEIPALRSLGQVVSIGILLSLLWAPGGLVLLSRQETRA